MNIMVMANCPLTVHVASLSKSDGKNAAISANDIVIITPNS